MEYGEESVGFHLEYFHTHTDKNTHTVCHLCYEGLKNVGYFTKYCVFSTTYNLPSAPFPRPLKIPFCTTSLIMYFNMMSIPFSHIHYVGRGIRFSILMYRDNRRIKPFKITNLLQQCILPPYELLLSLFLLKETTKVMSSGNV